MAKTYKVKIEGITDALHNKLSRELRDEQSAVPNPKKEEWEDDNWKRKLYTKKIDGKEEIIMPEMNLHKFLQDACKKYKVNPPKSIGRTWTNYIKSCVIVPEEGIYKNVKIEPFGCFVNGNPSSQKGSSKVWKVRPLIKKGWELTIILIDAEGYLNKKIVQDILETGGKFVGLSDWRPIYGRFIVKSVKVEGDV